MKKSCSSLLITIIAGILSGPIVTMGDDTQKAVAVLIPTKGNDVRGVITFTKVEGGIRVVADVSGLTPGEHGFHIHAFGDCSDKDGKAAGGHFNPHGKEHGGPMSEVRHAGDLGNLIANNEGNAHYDRVDSVLSLTGASSIIGRSVIVHEKVDDFLSQPTGAAGARVACGAIGIGQ